MAAKKWKNHERNPGPKQRRPYVWCDADDRKTARRIYETVARNKSTALDTEFSNSRPAHERIDTFQLSGAHGQRFVLHGQWMKEPLFRDWLGDPDTRIVYFAFNADATAVEEFCGIDLEKSFYVDVMAEAWCVDNTKKRYALKSEGADVLKWHRKEYSDLFYYVPEGTSKKVVIEPWQIMTKQLPDEMLRCGMTMEDWIDLFFHYGADDAEETHAEHRVFKRILKKWGYWPTFLDVDAPYTLTLRHFQQRGIPIDLEQLDRIDRKVSIDLLRHETAIRQLCGRGPELSLNRSAELERLIFEEWKWPTYDDLWTKPKEGSKSKPKPQLNKVAWNRYANEEGFVIAKLMLPHNKLRTLKSTFINGIRNGVKYGPGANLNILFSDYNQVGTLSGRMSSRKFTVEIDVVKYFKRKPSVIVKKKVKAGMNMLNFPNAFNDPFGLRSVVVPPDEVTYYLRKYGATRKYEKALKRKKAGKERKRVLVCGDFSGFELWMALYNCHKMGIKSEMLKALNEGKDVHSITAVAVCGLDCDWSEVKKLHPEKRNNEGKRCNFNLLYGGGAKMLCRILGWDTRVERNIRRAQAMIDVWNMLWPEMPKYQRRIVDFAYEHGYVETISGQRIWVRDGLNDPDEWVQRHWENVAKNGPCQGSAAAIIKKAQNLIEESSLDGPLAECGYEQYFNVYDEIVGSCWEDHADEAVAQVTYCMKQPFKEKLPFELQVEVKAAPNWKEAK
jgi:DNA polymerase I-like protein with 3'-5' exonuclease and polymerase domains